MACPPAVPRPVSAPHSQALLGDVTSAAQLPAQLPAQLCACRSRSEAAAPPWVTTQPLPSGLWWHSVPAGGAAFPRKALRHSAITFCCAVPSQAGRKLTPRRRTRAFPEAEVPAAEASAAPELLASGPVRLHTTAVSCKFSKLRGALLLHLWH